MIEAKRWYHMKRFDKVEELITNQMHSRHGSFIPSNRFELTKEGMINLIASYKDKGGSSIGSLTGKAQISLRSPLLKAAYADNKSNF